MVCNLLHFLAYKSVQEHPFPLKCGEGQRPPAPFPVCYAYGILSTLASIYEYMWQSAIDSHGAELKILLTFAIFGFVCLFACFKVILAFFLQIKSVCTSDVLLMFDMSNYVQ